MSLSTNSWDIVYTSKLDSINTVLPQDYKPKVATITANRYKLTITNIKGEIDISTSSETTLKFTLTFEGSYELISNPISNSLTNAAIMYSFDIDPLQTLGIDFNTSSGGGAFTTPDLLLDFLNYCKNSNFIQEYFSSLTIFKDLKWIDIAICKVAIKKNRYLTGKDKYISFCYMLSRKEKDTNGNEVEKAINYNDPYVDLNAIPEGATSALIIERSAFGEHMVVPQIANDVLVDRKKLGEGKGVIHNNTITNNPIGKYILDYNDSSFPGLFNKTSAYSFTNQKDCYLYYADFYSTLSYLGLVIFLDWIRIWGYHGTVTKNNANITINEDHINLRMKEVEYRHSVENYPKITQEYKATLTFDGGSLHSKVQLIDKDIKYFHTDFIAELWYIFGVSFFGGGNKNIEGGNRTRRIFDYLPTTQLYLKEQLNALKSDIDNTVNQIRKVKSENKDISINERLDASENLSLNSQRSIEKISELQHIDPELLDKVAAKHSKIIVKFNQVVPEEKKIDISVSKNTKKGTRERFKQKEFKNREKDIEENPL